MLFLIYDLSYRGAHILLLIYDPSYRVAHILLLIYAFPYRGYTNHAETETDSDGDGGSRPKLRGRGHIEFSKKGIPHGILHFPKQIQLSGHIYMHDTTGSEAAHRFNVKTAMDRVRKATDFETSASSIDWTMRVRTWATIIDMVNETCAAPKRTRSRCVFIHMLLFIYHSSYMIDHMYCSHIYPHI